MYFPFTSSGTPFPNEMVVNILLHASPLDLLQVQVTSRYFRDILEANQHLWRIARRSLNPPVPDPDLPIDMYERPRNWSESAYANHVFGRSKCSFCGDRVDHLWVHPYYSLRQVVCTKGECISAKNRDHIPLPKLKNNAPWYIRRLNSYMPYEGRTAARLRYSRMQIAQLEDDAKVAFQRFRRGRPLGRAYMEVPELREFRNRIGMRQRWLYAINRTGEALAIWEKEWVERSVRSGLSEMNMERVRGWMVGKNIKFSKIRGSITFRRWQLTFLKSQTVMDHSAWYHIKEQVLREVADADAGIVRLPLSKDWKGKVQCPFCPRVVQPRVFGGSVDLANHVRVKHPQNIEMVIRA